jgi:cell division septum initiation protein DivIVA
MVAFTQRLDDLNRQVQGAASALQGLLTETAAVKATLLRSPAPQDLRDRARALELEVLDLQQTLAGNETRALYNEGGPVPIARRLEVAVLGTFRSTYGPTPTHRRAVEIAEAEFAGVKERIGRINDRDLPDLRRELDAAGVPWTPGRGVPGTN